MAEIRIFLTTVGAGTWTVPDDWNSANNSIECIGGGGNGVDSSVNRGGGGGAYAKKNNLSLTPGASISYSVGAAGAVSWFKSTSDVLADCGRASYSTGNEYGAGLASNSVGDVKYNGGGGVVNVGGYSSPAGGAAGKNGAGNSAYYGSPVDWGGYGDNGYGGIGGSYNSSTGDTTPAGNGTEWDSTHGSGGGGGSGGSKNGGLYGAGGGGGDRGIGAQGLIVITYTPAVASGDALFFGNNF